MPVTRSMDKEPRKPRVKKVTPPVEEEVVVPEEEEEVVQEEEEGEVPENGKGGSKKAAAEDNSEEGKSETIEEEVKSGCPESEGIGVEKGQGSESEGPTIPDGEVVRDYPRQGAPRSMEWTKEGGKLSLEQKGSLRSQEFK